MPVLPGIPAASAAAAVEFPGVNRTFSRASGGFSGRPHGRWPPRRTPARTVADPKGQDDPCSSCRHPGGQGGRRCWIPGRESNVFNGFWRIFRATAWTMAAAQDPVARRRRSQGAGRDMPVLSGIPAAKVAAAVGIPGRESNVFKGFWRIFRASMTAKESNLRRAPPRPSPRSSPGIAWPPSLALTRKGGNAPAPLLPRGAVAEWGRTAQPAVEGARGGAAWQLLIDNYVSLNLFKTIDRMVKIARQSDRAGETGIGDVGHALSPLSVLPEL